jgi:glycosyltransferase involved in cell wall biosynthesis
MKIAQLVTSLQRGGAEVFACQLSDELVRRGHDVSLIGLRAAPSGALVPSCARAVDLSGPRRRGVSPWLLRRLMEELAADPPELVQANGSITLAYASLAKRRLDAGWPLVYRNIGIPSDWALSATRRLWVRWLLRGVDHVASVSEASMRDFARTFGFPPSRIVMIPRGTKCRDLEPWDHRRRRLATEAVLDAASPLLVHVGSFVPPKNHSGLIDVFARIVERRPDAGLVLIGDGPLAPQIRALVAGRGLEERVRFLGLRLDADNLIGGSDVLLLPSLTEGIPGVVLEAAAREVPAVAYDVGGVRQAIEDGRTGFVVPAGDSDALARRAVALLDDPDLARRMGEAARAHVCLRFDLPRIVDAFEGLYRQMIQCPVASASSI